MRKILYISFLAIIAFFSGCKDFEEQIKTDNNISIVKLLDDGRMMVSGTLSKSQMNEINVDSRATTEENIVSGWCLIFGEDATEQGKAGSKYTPDSPLLLKEKLIVNANGTFFITLPRYAGVAFLRIVVNLTPREEDEFTNVARAWGDKSTSYEIRNEEKWLKTPTNSDMVGLSTFDEYAHQSVGLDGIYNIDYQTKVDQNNTTTDANGVVSLVYTDINTNKPNPNTDLTSTFPMSSIGFVMDEGITVESIKEMFGKIIFLVRTCSKVDVTVSDNEFELSKVYMVDCAQEVRLRSTVLSESSDLGSTVTDGTFKIPIDLGGTISYEPLIEKIPNGNIKTTSPIYFYPNSGGEYDSNNGAVNQETNPQYIIIKGHAKEYDTDGYYKIALKAKYPLSYKFADEDKTILATDKDGNYIVETWSDLTYDILRNTHFKVNLKMIDKPGYKTLADAKDPNNPASNISYSITIISDDGRNEILISNGAYYVELETTRVYIAGYGNRNTKGAGTSGTVSFTLYPNSANEAGETGETKYKYKHPAVYVQADYGVTINSCTANGKDLLEIDLTDQDILNGIFDETSEYYDPEVASAYDSAADFYADVVNKSDNIHDIGYKVPSSETNTEVKATFFAKYSGRIRLRIGNMLKFIPVRYVDDMVPYTKNTLSISDETNFSYDNINYLDPTTDEVTTEGNYNWFTKNGIVKENTNTDERQLRAIIYPKMSDGVTKLYFYQTSGKDKDGRVDTVNDQNHSTGNVIYSDANSKTDNNESVTTIYDTAQEIADQAAKIINDGYSTIYINGEYTNGKYLQNDESVFDLINKQIGADVKYSIVLEDLNDKDGKCDMLNDLKSKYFQGNTHLTSVTLPANKDFAKIDGNAFSGCTSLTHIIIGSDNSLTKIDAIEEKAFYGCTALEYVTIYTNKSEVNYKSNSFTSSGLASKYAGDDGKVYVKNHVANFAK